MTFTGRRKTTTYRIITPGTRSFGTGGYNCGYDGDGLSACIRPVKLEMP